MEKGRVEGEAALLSRLLERRFGPLPAAVRQRIAAADADVLLVYGERVLDAKAWRRFLRGESEEFACCLQARLHVILNSDFLDEIDLGFQPVDMLFLALQNFLEQFAADVVRRGLAIGDGFSQCRMASHFQP